MREKEKKRKWTRTSKCIFICIYTWHWPLQSDVDFRLQIVYADKLHSIPIFCYPFASIQLQVVECTCSTKNRQKYKNEGKEHYVWDRSNMQHMSIVDLVVGYFSEHIFNCYFGIFFFFIICFVWVSECLNECVCVCVKGTCSFLWDSICGNGVTCSPCVPP